jgi:predicted ester cyclase
MSAPSEVVERHFAAFAAKDANAEPYSADAEVIAPGAQLRGRDQVLAWLRGYWEAFPDARLEAAHSIVSGQHVALEGKLAGTHTGVLRTPDGEVPATGRAVEIGWMAMYEVAGEELLSEHLYFDSADFLMQLGMGG